jgi:hypothetical protein
MPLCRVPSPPTLIRRSLAPGLLLFLGLALDLAVGATGASGPAFGPAVAHAQPSPTGPASKPGGLVYLPYAATVVAEPCGPALPESCPGGEGWTAVCGGMGRIRDLFALGDAEGTVLAVGDGAARWRAGALATGGGRSIGGLGPGAGWTPQIGQELTGLKAAYIPANTGGVTGWAAGDQGQTPEMRAGCWQAHPPADRYPDVELLSIRVIPYNGARIGWAVGRSGQDVAVARELKLDGKWVDHSNVTSLVPMLTDVAFEPHPEVFGEMPRAWAVGADIERREGVFARTNHDNEWTVRQKDESGWPREIILGQDNREGWAFGEHWDGSAVLAWFWNPENAAWERDERAPAEAWEGHTLVDAYQVPGTEIWLGVSPRSGRKLLHRFDSATGEWAAHGVSPYAEDDLDLDASSAIAAVPAPGAEPGGGAGLLYAWGEQVWWYDRAGDTWTQVRERHRWVDFVPDGATGWLLASSDQGSGLFTRQGDQIHPALDIDTALDPALTAAPMRALARGGGDTWAVGERGASVRLRGPLARPQVFHLPEAGQPRFVDVAVSPAGQVGAITTNDAGVGQVWWFDDAAAAWREQPLGPGAAGGRWNALAWSGTGELWVGGDGNSLSIAPSCVQAAAGRMTRVGSMSGGTLGEGVGLGSKSGGTPGETVGSSEMSNRIWGTESALEPVSGAGGVDPSCASIRPTCWCDAAGTGRAVCVHPNSPVAPDVVALAAAPGSAAVWAAGAQGIARNSGAGWCAEPALVGAGGENLLRSGARLVDLAVAAPDDMWAVAHCGRERSLTGRIACGDGEPILSPVLHFDGRGWTESTTVNVAIHDIDVAAVGDSRTVWLTGDWSTLIRHAYRVAGD